jgi:repressor LexA
MEPSAQRAALLALVAEQGLGLAELSRVIGRNEAYLQQYLQRGSPRLLAESDRAKLARYLDVPETRLGGPEIEGVVEVRRLDVGASAGPGRLAGNEAARVPGRFPPAQLRALGVRPEAASIIRVEGDSMEPTLRDGDEILVDGDQRQIGARACVMVLRLEGEVMVKRLRRAVGGIEVVSDNPDYPVRLCKPRDIDVIGRVAWLGRAL